MSITGKYTSSLWTQARALLTKEESEVVETVIRSWPTSYEALVQFDQSMGGPGFSNVSCNSVGRYHVDDRDVFRPLQYFGDFFSKAFKRGETEPFSTRELIHMSGLQLESLVKRIAGVHRVPLGQALINPLARRRINPSDWNRLQQFTPIFNAAKHDLDQPKDTHLFSAEDVILSYIIVRRLAASLYPLVHLHTDLKIFSRACS